MTWQTWLRPKGDLMTKDSHQRRSYAEYRQQPWRTLWERWTRRHHLRANPPAPKSDGLDYAGWTAQIFGTDPDDIFPRSDQVGAVGFVAESDEQPDGERTHRIEFETMSCQGIHLPAAHIELIPPDDPRTGQALILSVDDLINLYGPLRASVRPTANGHARYLIVTRPDEQATALPTLADLTHVDMPDPDGGLLDAAGRARRAFNHHAAHTTQPLNPTGPTVNELINGYQRPGSHIPGSRWGQ